MTFSTAMSVALVAGMMNGSFAVPMKYSGRWSWENTWLAWSFLGLLIFPAALTVVSVPHAVEIYAAAPLPTLFALAAFGAGWGISQVLFGLGIERAGVAVGFAIVVGLAAAVGTLVPLGLLKGAGALSASGLGVIACVLVVTAGIGICAWAGSKKPVPVHPGATAGRKRHSGILICVLAGIGGSMVNLGLAFSGPLSNKATFISSLDRTNLVWLPLLAAGFASTAVYCCRRLSRNGTWKAFTQRGARTRWLMALLMAVLWLGSVELYGIAAGGLGDWGPVLGWPVFLSASIVTANVWGLLTGEWRNAPVGARHLMWIGVAVTVAAIFLAALAGRRVFGLE